MTTEVSESIRLSALGRDIAVGDFYNYFTDEIFQSKSYFIIPKEMKFFKMENVSGHVRVAEKHLRTEPKSEVTRCFFFQQPEKFKGRMLGINSHFADNIEEGNVDTSDLWFANYLELPLKKDAAEVAVFFRVVRRIETLDKDFLNSKMLEYQLKRRGRATHLVEEVVYGTEIICAMSRPIDKSIETKESAEENICIALKKYFDQTIGPNSIDCEIPRELKNVTCKMICSHEAGHDLEGNFILSSGWLKNAINIETNIKPLKKWRPIEIVLRFIPDQIKARILSERNKDVEMEKERNKVLLDRIEKTSRDMSIDPSSILNRVSPLKKALFQFISTLGPLKKEIENIYEMLIRKKCEPDQLLDEIEVIFVLLNEMAEWLIVRRIEIDVVCSLLKGTELKMMDLEEIKTLVDKFTKVFVLTIDYEQDPLMEKILKLINKFTGTIPELPVFQIASAGKKRLSEVTKKLNQFADEATLNQSDRDTAYHIALVPSSSAMKDGTVTTLTQSNPTEQLEKENPAELTSDSPLLDSNLPPSEVKQLLEQSIFDNTEIDNSVGNGRVSLKRGLGLGLREC